MVEKRKITLALETAVGDGSAALLENDKVLAETSQHAARAAELLVTIEALMRDSDIGIHMISRIAVSNGPGSFTGIRVGIATALGLRRSLNAELKAVRVLEAVACSARGKKVTAIVSVGRGRFAIQEFFAGGEAVKPTSAPLSTTPLELVQRIRENPDARFIFAGNDDNDRCSLGEMIGQESNLNVLPETLASIIGRYSPVAPVGDPEPIYLDK